MDIYFEIIRGDLLTYDVHLNIATIEEHVAEINLSNRTVKKRLNTQYPTAITTAIVMHSVF